MTNRIRELRKAKGITMKQLGAALGLAESTISHYETGKRQLDNETLIQLSRFFGVTVGYILGAENNTPAETGKRVDTAMKLSDREILLIQLFRRLDERGQTATFSFMNSLYETQPGSKANSAPKQA